MKKNKKKLKGNKTTSKVKTKFQKQWNLLFFLQQYVRQITRSITDFGFYVLPVTAAIGCGDAISKQLAGDF